jgi:cytochrome c
MRSSRFLAGIGLAVLVSFEAAAAELHDAARRGDVATVERLLAGGAKVDEVDRAGATALYVAAGEGHVLLVVRLLAAGGNARHQVLDLYGNSIGTPIHAAIRYGHVDVVRVLLEGGVNPNLPDSGVGPPLHVAIKTGQAAAEKLLRSSGAKSIPAEPVDDLIPSADLAAGKKIAWTCVGCHDLTSKSEKSNHAGAPLWNVVGRAKASVRGFGYSQALQKFGGRWSYEDLNSYLANPRGFVPGTSMERRGIAEREGRAALIAYLRTLSDQPHPLP